MPLCLNLIVRQEKSNILNCLESFNKLAFQALAIVDTGSSDRTVEIVEEWRVKNNKKGGIISHPWREEFGPFHFAFNRNIALDYAYQVISQEEKENWYILFTDADNLLSESAQLEDLSLDAYYVLHKAGNSSFPALSLIKYQPELGWRWKGGLHELLLTEKKVSCGQIDSFFIHSERKGLRSQDPLKYVKDYLFLGNLISKDPELAPRYMFYLAQSLRDAQLELRQEVEKLYLKRARLEKGCIEERYVSYLEAFKQRFLRKGLDEKGAVYLQEALNLFPQRIEAPFYYLQFLLAKKRFKQAWILGESYLDKGKLSNPPQFFLMREDILYEFGFYDTLASVAFSLGKKEEAKSLWRLACDNAPETEKGRFQSLLKE